MNKPPDLRVLQDPSFLEAASRDVMTFMTEPNHHVLGDLEKYIYFIDDLFYEGYRDWGDRLRSIAYCWGNLLVRDFGLEWLLIDSDPAVGRLAVRWTMSPLARLRHEIIKVEPSLLTATELVAVELLVLNDRLERRAAILQFLRDSKFAQEFRENAL